MKKISTWVLVITFIIFVIDWGVIGLKLLNGNYDITTGAYIGAVCWGVIIVCIICIAFTNKCPHTEP